MKIGIDINPTLEKTVGKGLFLKNILIQLTRIDKKNEYYLYGIERPNFELGENFTFIKIAGKPSFIWDQRCVFNAQFKNKVDVFFSVKSFYSAISHPNSIILIHDVGPLKLPSAYPQTVVKNFKNLLKLTLKRAKRIITPSSVTKSYIVSQYNIPHRKIVKIPSAAPSWTKRKIQDEDLKRVITKYTLPQNFFLFAGTLEPRKNLVSLINSFKKFKEKDTSGYKLVIIGKKGYKFEEIFKAVIDLELSQEVIFTGHVPEFDLKPVYVLAKAFILPSLLEGFALSALEAMACEIPVICSKKGAIGETVGDACLEIDPRNVDSIASALQIISKDKDLYEKLIQKGLKRIKIYSWEKSAKKLLKIFKEVCS
ncbi:glycosyltransferase family 4 protein [Candidatus Dojkabacteria bacterium]|nr:glycosyltransferase family 4 protein [Candidatus Dojkabacteria bacterium]